MKKSLSIILSKAAMIIFIAINANCSTTQPDTSVDNGKEIEHENTIIQVILNECPLNWDNSKGRFVNDSYYSACTENICKYELDLCKLIADTTIIKASICIDNSRKTRLGDMAFIFIDSTINLPYYELFGIQFDVIDNCNYSVDLMSYINDNRKLVASIVGNYVHNECK